MGKIGEVIEWYKNLDYIDRQKFWMAVVGAIVILIGLYYIAGVFDVWGGLTEGAVNYTEKAVSEIPTT
jgi:hypothetical protein